MYTLKIYVNGDTFIKSCSSIHFSGLNSPELSNMRLGMQEERNQILAENPDVNEEDVDMPIPWGALKYAEEGGDGQYSEWPMFSDNVAYIVNENGKTIEAITPPRSASIAPQD